MTRAALFAAAAGLTVAAVAAGLWAVGGPDAARREAEDQRRLADLRAIAAMLRCESGTPPPVALEPVVLRGWCGGRIPAPGQLRDPFTGARYRYTRAADGSFRICAEFHDAAALAATEAPRSARRARFDPQAGCLLGRTDG